jgi:hypothetical protein
MSRGYHQIILLFVKLGYAGRLPLGATKMLHLLALLSLLVGDFNQFSCTPANLKTIYLLYFVVEIYNWDNVSRTV